MKRVRQKHKERANKIFFLGGNGKDAGNSYLLNIANPCRRADTRYLQVD